VRRRLILLVPITLALLGCPPRVKPGTTPILQPVPPPGTPLSQPAAGQVPGLPPVGHNSAEQLQREAAPLTEALRGPFERAFVLVFHQDKTQRDIARARELLRPLLEANFAPAWRVQGYTYIDDGFQMEPAIECYRRAIAADEGYGMAHYALAFTLTQTDPAAGKRHFQRAMELGVQDQRGLGQRFYQQ
jgi:tetratricopeptide (TPR) repeat protein